MSTNLRSQVPFLRVQRLFPQEAQALSVEIDRAYIDIANAVNSRMLGTFSSGFSTQNGETWYLNGLKYSGFRQFYPFTAAGSIPHGIKTDAITTFTKIYGTFTDGTNFYPLPYIDATAANNQISVSMTPTNIVITAGAGSPPTIVRGYIVLEYLTPS